jgi:hypothetical protein
MQAMNTIVIDQLPVFHAFTQVHTVLASNFQQFSMNAQKPYEKRGSRMPKF